MRIAIPAQGEDLQAEVDPRLGRASKFLLIDTETKSFKVIENTQNLNLPQGAGIQSAQNIIKHSPEVVLAGNCGPKAFKVFQAAGVEVVVGIAGKITDAIEAYLNGRYKAVSEPNVEGHWV